MVAEWFVRLAARELALRVPVVFVLAVLGQEFVVPFFSSIRFIGIF